MGERVRAERGENWPLGDDTYKVRFDGFKGRVWCNDEAKAQDLIDRVNTEPLPDGVYRFRGAFMLAAGLAVPEGWERYPRSVEVWSGRSATLRHGQVRPVPPAPATERVPWWEAVRNARTVVSGGDEFMATTAFFDAAGRFCIGTDAHDADVNVEVPADGTVEVLSLPEGEQQ